MAGAVRAACELESKICSPFRCSKKKSGKALGNVREKGKEEGQVLAAGTHGVGRKRRGTAADRRSSGEQICEPGGVLGARVWGKRRRGRPASYRRARVPFNGH